MPISRSLGVSPLLAFLTVFAGTAAIAQDETPEGLLKERGLTRSGVSFHIDESEALAALEGLRPAANAMKEAFKEYAEPAENEALYQEAVEELNLVNAEIEKIDQQLAALPKAKQTQAI